MWRPFSIRQRDMQDLIARLKLLRDAAVTRLDRLDFTDDEGCYTDYASYRAAQDAVEHLGHAIDYLSEVKVPDGQSTDPCN